MTKPIDVVISVAKALQGWDGSPGQAAEKLGAAAKAVQEYSARFLDPTGGIAYYQGKCEEALAEIYRLKAAIEVSIPQPDGLGEELARLIQATTALFGSLPCEKMPEMWDETNAAKTFRRPPAHPQPDGLREAQDTVRKALEAGVSYGIPSKCHTALVFYWPKIEDALAEQEGK